MTSTAASVSDSVADGAGEVSLVRLHVLRAAYLLLVVGLGATTVPVLFSHAPTARGVIPSLLCGMWLLWGYLYRHYFKAPADRWR